MRARFIGVMSIIRFTVVGVVVAVICVVGGGSDLECALSTRERVDGRRAMTTTDARFGHDAQYIERRNTEITMAQSSTPC